MQMQVKTIVVALTAALTAALFAGTITAAETAAPVESAAHQGTLETRETLETQNQPETAKESSVTRAVRKMMNAVSASGEEKAESAEKVEKAEKAQTSQDTGKGGEASAPAGRTSKASREETSKTATYPAVPAKYLRPGANPEEAKAAVAQLRKNVEAEDRAALQGKKGAQGSAKNTAGASQSGAGTAGAAGADAAAADDPERRKPEAAPVGQVHINTSTTIAIKPGENVFIPISREHPNRILTPFKTPQIISTSLYAGKKKGECGEACVRDGVIYITTDSASAVTAFITEKGHEDIAFSITMIPQAIPPREVRFTLPADVVERLSTRSADQVTVKKAQAWETSQPYVDTIREALRGVALGQVPSGYNLRKIRVTDPLPTCRHPGIDFKWSDGQLLEGFNLDIYVGVISNVADSPVEFRNQACGGWRIAAVTSWPLTVLKPGQKTEVYVIVKREDDVPDELVRKPLIPREYN